MKKTIVVSSHLLSEIQLVANRLLIIDKGKKMVEGDAATLFDPSQTLLELETLDNQKALLQLQQSPWQNRLQPLRERTIVVKVDKREYRLFTAHWFRWIYRLLSLQPRHSLEDYFLQVTTGNQHVEAFTN